MARPRSYENEPKTVVGTEAGVTLYMVQGKGDFCAKVKTTESGVVRWLHNASLNGLRAAVRKLATAAQVLVADGYSHYVAKAIAKEKARTSWGSDVIVLDNGRRVSKHVVYEPSEKDLSALLAIDQRRKEMYERHRADERALEAERNKILEGLTKFDWDAFQQKQREAEAGPALQGEAQTNA